MTKKFEKSKKAKIVALLHDVIEDSNVTIDDLKPYFTNDILQAILCVTKEENYDYENYLRRIKNNPLAKEVKIADLTHNMDLSRLSNITEDDLKRYEKI